MHDFILSPEMSISCSFSGFSGPTLMKRSLENLLSEISHLPSALLVSPMDVWLWPGWYWTSTLSRIGSTFFTGKLALRQIEAPFAT